MNKVHMSLALSTNAHKITARDIIETISHNLTSSAVVFLFTQRPINIFYVFQITRTNKNEKKTWYNSFTYRKKTGQFVSPELSC